MIETLRKSSIRATHPEDWVLFKAAEEQGGQVVGYLEDAGCDRVRDLWGIEIFDISRPEKVAGADARIIPLPDHRIGSLQDHETDRRGDGRRAE